MGVWVHQQGGDGTVRPSSDAFGPHISQIDEPDEVDDV